MSDEKERATPYVVYSAAPPTKGSGMMFDSIEAIDAALLDRFLRSVLPTGGHIVELRFLVQADDYAVIAVTLVDPRLDVVIKLAGLGAALACPFDRTAAMVGLIRSRTAVPTFRCWRLMSPMNTGPGVIW
jgi:hypothetical protein